MKDKLKSRPFTSQGPLELEQKQPEIPRERRDGLKINCRIYLENLFVIRIMPVAIILLSAPVFIGRPQQKAQSRGSEQHADKDAEGEIIALRGVEEQAEERRAAGGKDAGN